eukprot:GSMAST32.ASY1.ANO1.317.1 assembled CDS
MVKSIASRRGRLCAYISKSPENGLVGKYCKKKAQGKTKLCFSHGGGIRCLFFNKETGKVCNIGARGKTGLCSRHGGGRRCQFVSRSNVKCTRGSQGKTPYCIAHGGGRRCIYPDCSKGAIGNLNQLQCCKLHGGGWRCTYIFPGGQKCTAGSMQSNKLYCSKHCSSKKNFGTLDTKTNNSNETMLVGLVPLSSPSKPKKYETQNSNIPSFAVTNKSSTFNLTLKKNSDIATDIKAHDNLQHSTLCVNSRIMKEDNIFHNNIESMLYIPKISSLSVGESNFGFSVCSKNESSLNIELDSFDLSPNLSKLDCLGHEISSLPFINDSNGFTEVES